MVSCSPSASVPSATLIPPTETKLPRFTTTDLSILSVSTTVNLTPTVESQKLKEIVFSPCLTISPEPPGGNEIPWLLLVQRAAVFSIEPNSGLKSAQLIPSPEHTDPFAYDFALSPDGKWLAYELFGENNDLVIEPSENLLMNRSQGRIIWRPENPFQIQGWLSNDSIALRIYRAPDKFASTLIRNPFKEEGHEFFLEDMPNYLYYQPGMSGAMLFASSNLMPDPTLQRVVYPAISDDLYYMAALWDVKNKKVVTSLRLFFDWADNDPLWSLDGSDFVIMGIDGKGYEEWFQVTRDGVVKQVTHFGDLLKDYRFGSSSRSPDGRYLAFTLWNEKSTYEDSTYKYKYLILDLKSQSLDGLCIDTGGKSNPEKTFAWSPDNRYLSITNGTIGKRSAEVILVELEKQEAYNIATDVEAIGWMVKP